MTTGEVIALIKAFGGGGGGSSGGGALVVNVTLSDDNNLVCDKTAGEIINAMPFVYVVDEDVGDAATSVIFRYFTTDGGGNPCYYILPDGAGYGFYYIDVYGGDHMLSADTLNDYPTDNDDK